MCQSEDDEQIIINIVFREAVCIHSINIVAPLQEPSGLSHVASMGPPPSRYAATAASPPS